MRLILNNREERGRLSEFRLHICNFSAIVIGKKYQTNDGKLNYYIVAYLSNFLTMINTSYNILKHSSLN
jgi:hypothetical protein